MFGKNEIVGRSFFKDMPVGTLYVTSIFYTLQGEGPFMGKPAIFLRLGKCNLDCSFCDTYFDHGDVMTFEAIKAKIANALQDTATNASTTDMLLVITGGEPLIQPNLPSFIASQANNWADIQIETNGTQGAAASQCADYAVIVVSPKCFESHEAPLRYPKPNINTLQAAYCLKFVVTADSSSPYHTIPTWASAWAKSRGVDAIYISPMNMYLDQPREMKIAVMRGIPTMEERSSIIEKVSFWDDGILDRVKNRANHEYAAKYCMEHGYSLNLQMHLYCSIA